MFARRLNEVKPTIQSLKTMITLTQQYNISQDCIGCSYDHIYHNWNLFRKDAKKMFPNLLNKYLIVVEPHKSMFPHYHILTEYHNFNKNELSDLRSLYPYRLNVSQAKNPSGYAYKYLAKEQNNDNFQCLLSSLNKRQYYTSKSLLPSVKTIREKYRDPKVWYVGSGKEFSNYSEYRCFSKNEAQSLPFNLNWEHICSNKSYSVFGKRI